MQAKYKAVIADTSCFILLDKIDGLNILQQLFKKIIVSPVIANEFGKLFPDWVEIKPVQNKSFLKILLVEVDPGEASVLALAAELQPSLLIVDDLKGRKLAGGLKLT
jgi:predicted nucleic acid-binding protein